MPLVDPRRIAHRIGIDAGRALQALGIEPRAISADRLIERAERETGVPHDGCLHPAEPLTLLAEDLNHQANLHLPGRLAAHFDLLRMLTHRLRLERDLSRNPRVRQQPIARPVFIVGLPRTGTTILHQLLAQDPRLQVPTTWELLHPIPDESGDPSADRPERRARAAARLPWMDAMSPGFSAAHPLHADDPQECISITAHVMRSHQFQSMYLVPTYQRWLEQQPQAPVYAFHRRFLQYLQAQRLDPDALGKTWVLKAPAHLTSLEALLEIYPDARVIQTHREPTEVMPSVASLCVLTRSAFSGKVEPHQVGREMFLRWSAAMDSAMAARDRLRAKESQFLDVPYRSLIANPMAALENIYRHCELGWTDCLEQRLVSALGHRRKNRYGVHRYDLESFSLNGAEINERLSSYRRRFL